jgi:type IV secretory pathway VirB2 component (pilin)
MTDRALIAVWIGIAVTGLCFATGGYNSWVRAFGIVFNIWFMIAAVREASRRK